jgi:hypothetical protein
MGRTYGRTMYWIWLENEMVRVRLCPGAIVIKNVAYPTFYLDFQKGCFTIDPRALAKTKKIALENKEEMEKYEIHSV